ncbi:MAG: T9SS type A sorting domain-containing protein [Candidatus Cloacimonetes bacterium]|nr:T9SS type A sorting domain-containing protein [Candidatus Cloacimonadota bacterium]MCF7814586.1 T9SS type A sorting domain-containing protein [Candidatus Cloacimonadota bacterium]MCF7869099.1 T9SS type A sorting domain-containing protein [Candidatus Cloacimonadota bacterium]MCF7884516.1 T9SS type A sorting domain-containing protein [Candidatus Cloacimonadota bacterium]
MYTGNDHVIPMIWESGGPNPSPGYAERMSMYNPGGGVPHARFGGTMSVVGGMPSGAMNYLPQYNALINTDSPLDMNVTMDVNDQNELVISTDVEVTGNISTTNNKVTFIVTLEVDDDWFCVVMEYDHNTDFDLTTIGQTATYEKAFVLNPSWDLSKIHGVAMVQSYTSNYLILQAKSTMFTGLLPLFSANITEGPAYLGVQFTSNSLPQTGIDSWEWDFDGDGTFDSTDENPFHMYTTPGVYDVTLRITVGGETAETTATDLINVTDGSNITGDLSGIWLSDFNPYNVTDDVSIAESDELVIQPGVEINFQSGNMLTVYGKFTADANVDTDDPIIMTSATDWEGIRFVGSTDNNLIQGCEISNANVCAISIENGSVVDVIENKLFNNSSASVGAAIDVASSDDVLISRNIIANNTSSNLIGGIGAIDSAIEISNNVIVNNTGTYGAFSLKNGSDAMIVNNTIANNESTNGTPYEMFLFNAMPIFKNNIIVDEADSTSFFAPFGLPEVTYTCIYDGFEGNEYPFPNAIGNIDINPLFEAPTAGAGVSYDGLNASWWLQDGSPCIDAGDPDAMYNDPDGTRNDMGAYGGPNALTLPVGNDDDPITVVANSNINIYPNPFNPQTSIALNLTDSDKQNPVSVQVYNVKGQLVRTLVDNEILTNASIIWDGTDNTGRHTSSGMYFAKVNTQSNTITKKMVLLK